MWKSEVGQAAESTETTTGTVRGIAGLMFWVGVGGLFVAPPIGLVLMAVGGIVWAFAPANAPATQAMIDHAAEPAGCGYGCAAVVGAALILALAGAVALVIVGGGVESANEISLASRKIAEQPVSPEIVEIDGELWLNLGSGLLAEAAAAMLVAQFPADARAQQNGMEEWLIWHRAASQDAYNAFRCIIMFRF